MPYRYKETFIFRDEIGTCPNREVEIDVVDKTPFFIWPYHVKEQDKQILDKETKRQYHLDMLRKVFSAYSSPVMLLSRKLSEDKKCVSDFRIWLLNIRIAKTSLVFP